MTYNGKKVWTQDTFDYDKVQIGDYVEAAIVMDRWIVYRLSA